MSYRRDVEPENKQELMRRDQEFRASVGKMSKVERQNLKDTISEVFKISKETASKWISPTANPNSKAFRTMFTYNKNAKVPEYIKTSEEFNQLPRQAKIESVQLAKEAKAANKIDAVFNAKLRFSEAVVNGKSEGQEVKAVVKEGVENGVAFRGMGNSVTGIDEKRLYRYLLQDNLSNSQAQMKLKFQSGGSVYLEYYHDSPNSSGKSLNSEDYEDSDLVDRDSSLYG
ncbi:MAG: hypothetical protein RMZ43_033175 [Nostoc sp. CmiVER01]|uniref:hypothetical protein n=1 Tax=Nostoc sp. CmiVER01 TaxID=3075384 RepID=UPI002AD62D46|nr:hypothetical protein [Nostoc sp. CmiVER01]